MRGGLVFLARPGAGPGVPLGYGSDEKAGPTKSDDSFRAFMALFA